MQRAINSGLMLATLAAAFALYAIKNDTRQLEARVHAQERALERAQVDVSVLRAERAHLARPARLEPLARSLGLAPITASQYLRLDIDIPPAVAPPTPNPSPHHAEGVSSTRRGGGSRDAPGGPASQTFRGR